MSFDDFHIRAYGAQAILVQWRAVPSAALMRHLGLAKKHIERLWEKEVILSYQELLIKDIAPSTTHIEALSVGLRQNFYRSTTSALQRRLRVPVCYETGFGEDLHTLAKAKNRTPQQLIALHTTPEYLVYFLGFLPGFPYLLGLDSRLHTPRKAVPSRKLVKGSVAIGGEQTGIYPQDSPGGWHVIGHCPIPLFDSSEREGSLFTPGDRIRFQKISKLEHTSLSAMSIKDYLNSSYVSYD